MAAETRRWTASCSSRPPCTGTPSSTTSRPPTTVCRADTGPQRSHASTGSDSAPANRTPSSAHTTRSPQAPTDSSPISPVRPRQAAPPRVAISRASRADIEAAPCRSLPCSIAVRASSHSDAESADDDPSTPSPTGAPAARSSATGDSPLPRIMLDDGQCAAPTRAAPSRVTSSASGQTTCASHTRSLIQPTSAR